MRYFPVKHYLVRFNGYNLSPKSVSAILHFAFNVTRFALCVSLFKHPSILFFLDYMPKKFLCQSFCGDFSFLNRAFNNIYYDLSLIGMQQRKTL